VRAAKTCGTPVQRRPCAGSLSRWEAFQPWCQEEGPEASGAFCARPIGHSEAGFLSFRSRCEPALSGWAVPAGRRSPLHGPW
jgi:hypothetical protein